jgi:hypothetical protein
MNRTPYAVAAMLAVMSLSLLAACASAPVPSRQSASDCPALDAEIARAAEAQRSAEQKRHDAWKSVLPVAAAARFGQGMVEATQSEQKLRELRGEAARQGCDASAAASGTEGNGISTTAQEQGPRVRSVN